jgi:hypothetical protein
MKPGGENLALAMTWDGARWPVRRLPAAARAFLKAEERAPSSAKVRRFFEEDRVSELRVCWVPRLRGGENVLCAPFMTTTGLRLGFRTAKINQFGDVLGVVYRRIGSTRST